MSDRAHDGDRRGPSHSLPRRAILLVLLLAFGLRFASIGFDLDFENPRRAVFNVNLDERGMVFEELELMEGDWHPGLFVMRGTAPFFLDGIADAGALGAISLLSGDSWSETVERARQNPSLLFLIHRVLAALASLLTVLVVMRMLARELTPRIGLLAGLLLACSYLPVHLSHLGVIDLGWVLFAMLAIDRLLVFLREPRRGHLVVAGICIGISGSYKYPGGLLVSLVALAYAIRRFEDMRARRPRLSLASLGAALAACLATFILLNPHLILWPQEFLDAVRLQFDTLHVRSENSIHWDALLAHLTTTLPLGIGEPVALLAAIGLPLALLHGGTQRRLALLLLLTLPTAMIAKIPTPRFAIGIATAAIPLAAIGLDRLLAPLNASIAAALSSLLLLPSLARCVSFDVILTRRDTRSEMVEHLDALGVPARDVIAIGHRGLPDLLHPPLPFINLFAKLRQGKSSVSDVLEHPPAYLLRDLNPGRSDAIVWEPFRALVEAEYDEVLHLDGRDPRGAPVRPAGYYITPRLFLPFAAPWLRARPGPGLVLYERRRRSIDER